MLHENETTLAKIIIVRPLPLNLVIKTLKTPSPYYFLKSAF